jgi:hypothetical protein
LAFGGEIVVTPKQTNGWTFGYDGSSKTAKWFLGYNRNAPNLGSGDFWMFTGEVDAVPYAETSAYSGVPLASLTRIGYDSFTPDNPLRSDIQMAPELRLYLDVPGKPGVTFLQFAPGLVGKVPTGRWTTWNPLTAKWFSNREGTGVLMTLEEWSKTYANATLKNLRIKAGSVTNDKKSDTYRIFNNWVLGVDNVAVSYGLNEVDVYNFESDPEPQPQDNPKVKPVIPDTYIIINPLIIENPLYYIWNGDIINNTVVQKPENTKEKPAQSKPDSYKTESGIYVPILFNGNTTLKEVLSQLANVGNPDETIQSGNVKITEGGAYLFGGVPFYIPAKNNTWDVNKFQDDSTHRLVVPVRLKGVTELRTIIGLTYATGAPETVFVEFRGSNGGFYRKELVVNQDVRDMRTSKFSKIVSPTVVVWSRPLMQLPKQGADWEMFLDMQQLTLPKEFEEQTLQSITIIDKGKHNAQRLFIAGMTAKVKTISLDKE